MENKKIDVLFVIVLVAFVAVTFILIKDFNAKRANDFKEYSTIVSTIVRSKDEKIRELVNLLGQKEKENQDLKNTLTETRNDLDNLSKKLSPTTPAVPVAAPVVAPVAAKTK